MIKIRNVMKKYRIGKEYETVLNDVNLEIKQGEFVALLGESGCGKSTLLNIIGGLENEYMGEFYIEDQNTNKYKEKDWNNYRKSKIGFIFQDFNLIAHLTAGDNIELAMKFRGKKEAEQRKRTEELLDMVGLKDKINALPCELSGGQKQRVAIARALANQPRLILADEPTGALDSKSAREVMDILHKIHDENHVTILMVTHNKQLAKEADRVISMQDGHVTEVIEHNLKQKVVMEELDTVEKKGKMSFKTAVSIGLQNVFQKKKRSILTVCGTAIGIAGMVIMLGVGDGAQKVAYHELRTFVGDKTIWVTHEDQVKPFTKQDLEALKKVKDVDLVLDNYLFDAVYYLDGQRTEGLLDVFGPLVYQTEYEASMASYGVVPNSDSSNEIVITEDIANKLLGEKSKVTDLLGQTITVVSKLRVPSEMTNEVERQFVISGISASGIIAGSSFIPYDTASKMASESCKSGIPVQKGAEVRTVKGATDEQVMQTIEALSYKVAANERDFKNFNIAFLALKIFLVFIAAVALFVSAIMIKIVLQTSVMERTREIGIMRAIGASKKEVKRIFIAEAGVLGAMSGIFGVILGGLIGLSINQIIAKSFHTEGLHLYQMNVKIVLFSLIISILIAALAGTKPAKKAARVNVTEALRYE